MATHRGEDKELHVNHKKEAMKYLAPAANALGWEVEESAAAVMAFGDAGRNAPRMSDCA